MKDIHKCILITRIMHILFHEQMICGRGTKVDKGTFVESR